MRTNLLSCLLVSMTLTLASACSGDDGTSGGSASGDTGTTSTGSSTSSTGSSTAASTSTTGPTTATDTGTGTSTGDTGTAGSDTGTAGSDTGTGGSGSTGGGPGTGGGAADCGMFCADYIDTCGNTNFNDYDGLADCIMTCMGWNGDQLSCRVMHLGLVQDPPNDGHCGHASKGGGGVCS